MIKITIFAIVAIALVSAGCDDNSNDKKSTALQWTGASFKWPCQQTEVIYRNSGRFVNKNIIATRAQIYKDQVFIAMPRYRCGVAATLAVTSADRSGCSATLVPFPCWSMQEEGNCKALQSVVDIYLDGHDILWVLDTGVINSLEHPVRRCPPKVVAIDVKTKKVVKVLDLSGLVCAASRLQYLVVDFAADGRCFVYVSDAATRAILVFDVAAGKGYRVVLPKAVVAGCSKRDVLYLALVRKSCSDNVLYFSYLSSNRIFSIRTAYLQCGSTKGHVHDVGIKHAKLVFLGTDGGSCIFFRYEGESEVYRWDTKNAFKQCAFTPVYRSATCMLATHTFADYKRGQMRVLESNFPDYIQGTVGCGAIQQINVLKGCF